MNATLLFRDLELDAGILWSKVLEIIARQYPLKFFFAGNMLCCVAYGELQPMQGTRPVKFKVGENMVEHGLTYTQKENLKIKIVGRAIVDIDGIPKEVRAECGKTPDDAIREYRLIHLSTPEEVKAAVRKIYDNTVINKMSGTMTAFGEPFVQKGDVVHLFEENKAYNDKKFLVTAVKYTFNEKGYRQIITLGNEYNE